MNTLFIYTFCLCQADSEMLKLEDEQRRGREDLLRVFDQEYKQEVARARAQPAVTFESVVSEIADIYSRYFCCCLCLGILFFGFAFCVDSLEMSNRDRWTPLAQFIHIFIFSVSIFGWCLHLCMTLYVCVTWCQDICMSRYIYDMYE